MGAKGVLVCTDQSARMWVGPLPAWRLALAEMRQLRDLDGVVLCNFSGGPLDGRDHVEVIDMERSWQGQPFMPAVYQEVLKRRFGETLLVSHACTPLVPAAAMEKCLTAVAADADVAQTVIETQVGFQSGFDHWEFKTGLVPVLGVRAFRAAAVSAWDRFGTSTVKNFRPVPITRKQGLSLLDECDLELVQSLEHSGRL